MKRRFNDTSLPPDNSDPNTPNHNVSEVPLSIRSHESQQRRDTSKLYWQQRQQRINTFYNCKWRREERRTRELEKEYDSIHKFLLFNFILANDTRAVHTILKQKRNLDLRLTGHDVKNYLNGCPGPNILCEDRYRTLFRLCLRDMMHHRLRIARHVCYKFLNKSVLDKGDDEEDCQADFSDCPAELYNYSQSWDMDYLHDFVNNYTNDPEKDVCYPDVNLLELACVLCRIYNSTDIVAFILKKTSSFHKGDLHVITCNPSVNSDCITQLLQWWSSIYVLQGNYEHNYDRLMNYGGLPPIQHKIRRRITNTKPFIRLRAQLSSSIITFFDACQSDSEYPLCDSEKDATLSKITTFFQGMSKTMAIKNSCVFRICLQYNEYK